MALARLSSKIEISNEQVEKSISRLSAKNLIRKIYLQGKVGFELTPKGRSTIEILAKSETERITKQLQEAIHQERKAKLRMNAVNKMKSVEEEWQNYQIPDKKLIDETEQEATKFLAATKEIATKQPFCHEDSRNYDQEFLIYKPQIEKMAEQNNNLSKAVNNYAKIKKSMLSLSADIENIKKTINKYQSIVEASTQVNELKTSLCRLESIQSQLDNFDKEQLSKFEELKIQLGENSKLLEILKKPTHEFSTVKRENLTEKTDQYPDPECPIKYGDKTSGHSLIEKCGKCGMKRKSSPVNIG